MMPMPLPATSQIASCAFRSTGSGRTAGPAEKLKIRLLMVLTLVPSISLSSTLMMSALPDLIRSSAPLPGAPSRWILASVAWAP